MTRITKYITLLMPSGSNIATTNIQIPFDVKQIITKTAVLKQTFPTNSFVCLISDLIDWSPHKILWDEDVSVYYASTTDIVYEFVNPRNINGTYTFRLKDDVNADYTAPGDIKFCLLLEFLSSDD